MDYQHLAKDFLAIMIQFGPYGCIETSNRIHRTLEKGDRPDRQDLVDFFSNIFSVLTEPEVKFDADRFQRFEKAVTVLDQLDSSVLAEVCRDVFILPLREKFLNNAYGMVEARSRIVELENELATLQSLQ